MSESAKDQPFTSIRTLITQATQQVDRQQVRDLEDQLERASGDTSTDVDGSDPRLRWETCICAAIRFFKDGTIIRGHRHDSCYKTAMAIPALNDYLHQAEQGFVTSLNRFVDRREGMRLQKAAGIESVAGSRGDILFSEDLY